MPILGLNNIDGNEDSKEVFHFPTSKNALIIFTRNPELGKCKTRLAATIGDKKALDIYKFLIDHTVTITANAKADKFVYYSEEIQENDAWDNSIFRKALQEGDHLGERMYSAFGDVLRLGYQRAVILGSDMYDLSTNDINEAFAELDDDDFVIGPAQDGGYYLLGLKSLHAEIFEKKSWGSDTVLKDTLKDLRGKSIHKMSVRNDVDIYEDIKDIEVFQKFL